MAEKRSTNIYWEVNDGDLFKGLRTGSANKKSEGASKVERPLKPWLVKAFPGKKTKFKKPTNTTIDEKSVEKNNVIDKKTPKTASLKDLRAEDKHKVANLIQELARAGEDKELALSQLKRDRENYIKKIKDLINKQKCLVVERDQMKESLLDMQLRSKQAYIESQKLMWLDLESHENQDQAHIIKDPSQIPGNVRNRDVPMIGDQNIKTYYPLVNPDRICSTPPRLLKVNHNLPQPNLEQETTDSTVQTDPKVPEKQSPREDFKDIISTEMNILIKQQSALQDCIEQIQLQLKELNNKQQELMNASIAKQQTLTPTTTKKNISNKRIASPIKMKQESSTHFDESSTKYPQYFELRKCEEDLINYSRGNSPKSEEGNDGFRSFAKENNRIKIEGKLIDYQLNQSLKGMVSPETLTARMHASQNKPPKNIRKNTEMTSLSTVHNRTLSDKSNQTESVPNVVKPRHTSTKIQQESLLSMYSDTFHKITKEIDYDKININRSIQVDEDEYKDDLEESAILDEIFFLNR